MDNIDTSQMSEHDHEDIMPVADGDNDAARYRFSQKLVTLSEPGTIRSEAISALRSHLLAQHVRDGKRALAICAPAAGAGCSYLSANLAMAMSQAGVKTLLIDANMRDSAIQDYILPPQEASNIPGLVQVLREPDITFGDAIHSDVIANLSVLYSGGTTTNIQELLAQKEFREIAESSMRDFDLTIVDTPPSNKHADSRRIASAFRYAMVVARRDETFVSDMKRLVEDLKSDRADVVGTFLNEY